MNRRSARMHRRVVLAATAVIAIAGGMFATPAAADVPSCPSSPLNIAPKTGTLVAECMDASQVVDPPGSESPGYGSATIWIDMTINQLAFEVHTEGLSLPIQGAMVYEGGEGEVGPEWYTLFGWGYDPDPTGCHSNIDPELRDLLQKSKPFYIEVYDAQWNDGAIRAQLVYTDKSGSPPASICGSG